jgi:hypothetical protein
MSRCKSEFLPAGKLSNRRDIKRMRLSEEVLAMASSHVILLMGNILMVKKYSVGSGREQVPVSGVISSHGSDYNM